MNNFLRISIFKESREWWFHIEQWDTYYGPYATKEYVEISYKNWISRYPDYNIEVYRA